MNYGPPPSSGADLAHATLPSHAECTACAGKRLTEPYCIGCTRLLHYMHLAFELKDDADAIEQGYLTRQALRHGTIESLIAFAIALVMAWAGVRAPMAYVSLMAAWYVTNLAVLYLGMRISGRDARRAAMRLQMRYPAAYAKHLVDGRALAEHVYASSTTPVPPGRPE
jgi:hypothetical protein